MREKERGEGRAGEGRKKEKPGYMAGKRGSDAVAPHTIIIRAGGRAAPFSPACIKSVMNMMEEMNPDAGIKRRSLSRAAVSLGSPGGV